jgi:hypothetical protein
MHVAPITNPNNRLELTSISVTYGKYCKLIVKINQEKNLCFLKDRIPLDIPFSIRHYFNFILTNHTYSACELSLERLYCESKSKNDEEEVNEATVQVQYVGVVLATIKPRISCHCT